MLQLPNGIPSHDTWGRVVAALKPDQCQACLASWVTEVGERLGRKPIAIDGKTLRGPHDRGKGQVALPVLSAWAVANHRTLAQQAVDPASNAITAMPKLLQRLDLDGALVTIDARGCPKVMAAQVGEQGGEYGRAVKENQPQLYEEMEQRDEAAWAND